MRCFFSLPESSFKSPVRLAIFSLNTSTCFGGSSPISPSAKSFPRYPGLSFEIAPARDHSLSAVDVDESPSSSMYFASPSITVTAALDAPVASFIEETSFANDVSREPVACDNERGSLLNSSLTTAVLSCIAFRASCAVNFPSSIR